METRAASCPSELFLLCPVPGSPREQGDDIRAEARAVEVTEAPDQDRPAAAFQEDIQGVEGEGSSLQTGHQEGLGSAPAAEGAANPMTTFEEFRNCRTWITGSRSGSSCCRPHRRHVRFIPGEWTQGMTVAVVHVAAVIGQHAIHSESTVLPDSVPIAVANSLPLIEEECATPGPVATSLASFFY